MQVERRSTLARLFGMRLPELVARGRQETFKLFERFGPAAEAKREASPDTTGFLQNFEKVFFEGPCDRRVIPALMIEMHTHCEELLARAEEIIHGRFDLLGYSAVEVGDQPDWHFEPVAGRRAPFVHWSQLDPLDYSTVGDSKVVWELNRHQWLVTLAQVYRLTSEERYAQTALRHIQAWIGANPRGIGINWASSLEVAFRLIAWCWMLALIRDARAWTTSEAASLLRSIEEHASHIERYLSHYFSPNTHLTGEALGLFYAGVLFPDLKRAERWRSLGAGILIEEIERQVLPDGVYFEQSTCYQRYTVDIYLHFLILAARAGVDVPPIVTERVRSMLDVLIALRQPDGSMPSIGDADGGRLLPLSSERPHDFQSTFSTAAVFFQEPSYAWAAQELSPETVWLLGTRGAAAFRAIKQAPPTSSPSRIFRDGGFAVLRTGWDFTAHSLIFDAGPLGCPVSSGHGHADLLSIQCSAFGQRYLVDAGTYCYTADAGLRDFFRGTAAHNTVMIDGRGQAEPAGPFAWKSRPEARLLHWESSGASATVEAEHDAYGVVHRRRVQLVDSKYWVVTDDLIGSGVHRVELRFQFAPMLVAVGSDGWVRASARNRQTLLLRAFASVPFEVEVCEGWVSSNYGHREPAPSVVYRATPSFPVRITTQIWPVTS